MARKALERSDSSLSPPPEKLATPADTKVAVNGRKRKADATAETPKPNKRAAATKKATTTRKKAQEDAPPVEERTTDTKLRVGAHVSVAGGRSYLFFCVLLARV
jgi:AP endonuclease-1